MNYRLAGAADEALLRRLLRDNPMAGWVDLCLTREPDYFAAAALFGDSQSVIAETDDGTPQGMYACTLFELYVNGAACPVLYLHSLRLHPDSRRRLTVLRGGFASIPRLIRGFERAGCCLTSIATDNHAARRMLEAGVVGLPHYQACGELTTLVIAAQRGRRHGLLRRATAADIPALAAFYNAQACRHQFAPVLSENWLCRLSPAQGLSIDDFLLYERDGKIRACLALWDQRFCKQTLLRGYRQPLGQLRPLYNLWAAVTKSVRLPAPGESLQQIFLAFTTFDDLALTEMTACLDEALYRVGERGAACAVLGIAPESAYFDALVQRYQPQIYRTTIETVAFAGQSNVLPDGRLLWPETALL